MTDATGNKSYNAVVRLAGKSSAADARLNLSPNPVATTLKISGLFDVVQNAVLTDLNGKTMQQFSLRW